MFVWKHPKYYKEMKKKLDKFKKDLTNLSVSDKEVSHEKIKQSLSSRSTFIGK